VALAALSAVEVDEEGRTPLEHAASAGFAKVTLLVLTPMCLRACGLQPINKITKIP
jgi:hypothetical protein